jgi:NAD-dependent deacetylase sirtuin 5
MKYTNATHRIPTFRGSGALWHNHKAASLSSPEVFEINPGLVWAYHASRRKMAIEATPNKGHVALAEMAHRKKGFVTLTQNIDGWFFLFLLFRF